VRFTWVVAYSFPPAASFPYRRRAPQHWRTAVEVFLDSPSRPSLRLFATLMKGVDKWT
jgi:hypothetical protein